MCGAVAEDRSLYVLYALLHDVGKPLLRAWIRHSSGLDHLNQNTSDKLKELVERCGGSSADHQCLSDQLYKRLVGFSPSSRLQGELNEILLDSDPLAAAERGFSVDSYGSLAETINKVSKCLESRFKNEGSYTHYSVPMLSATWMLEIAGYEKHLLPKSCGGTHFDGREAFSKVREVLGGVLEEITRGNYEAACESLYRFISQLKGHKLWLAPKVLKPELLMDLRARSYEEAAREMSYGEIAEYLLRDFDFIANTYKDLIGVNGAPLGSIETFGELLKYQLLTTPSAVFASLLPDIDLYSHSKLTATYAAAVTALNGSTGRFRLFVIDANGIQQFISAPTKAKAASRVLRGRSLLVELALDSLSRYALKLFGNLPDLNVIVSEGGTLDILIPDVEDAERRKKTFDEVSRALSREEFSYRLTFTSALSMPYDKSKLNYLKLMTAREQGEGAFDEVLESLSENLALEKARTKASFAGARFEPHEVAFDAVTGESAKFGSKYSIVVGHDNKEYVDRIGGAGKFDAGDFISPATHFSLVAGTSSRNLAMVISVYTYKKGDEGIPLPCRECIDKLIRRLRDRAGSQAPGSGSAATQLYLEYSAQPVPVRLGFIPLESAGALHILVDPLKPFSPFEDDISSSKGFIEAFLSLFKDSLARSLEELRKDPEVPPDSEFTIRFKVVNAAASLIDMLSKELAREIVSSLGRLSDVGFGTVFASSYHPYQEVEGGERVKLMSLDEYDMIALIKADIDYLGEAVRLISFWPSKLVSLSDTLNAGIAGKTYLKSLREFFELKKKGYNLDVIPLYAGGDDLVIYGSWAHVLAFFSDLYKSLRDLLSPLSLTASAVLGKSDAPILDIYREATAGLREAKNSARKSIYLFDRQPRQVRICGDGKETATVITVPFTEEYPWNIDSSTASWNLELFGELVKRRSLDELGEYLRDIDILSRLASLIVEHPITREGGAEASIKLDELVRLELGYAYIWERRGNELRKMLEIITSIKKGAMLLTYPDDTFGSEAKLHEALRVLEASKPLLDLIAIAVRKKDTLEHAPIREVKG